MCESARGSAEGMGTGDVACDATLADKDLVALGATLKIQGWEALAGKLGVMGAAEMFAQLGQLAKVVAAAVRYLTSEWATRGCGGAVAGACRAGGSGGVAVAIDGPAKLVF